MLMRRAQVIPEASRSEGTKAAATTPAFGQHHRPQHQVSDYQHEHQHSRHQRQNHAPSEQGPLPHDSEPDMHLPTQWHREAALVLSPCCPLTVIEFNITPAGLRASASARVFVASSPFAIPPLLPILVATSCGPRLLSSTFPSHRRGFSAALPSD